MSTLNLTYTVMPISNDNYHVIVRSNGENFLVKKSFARDVVAVQAYLYTCLKHFS